MDPSGSHTGPTRCGASSLRIEVGQRLKEADQARLNGSGARRDTVTAAPGQRFLNMRLSRAWILVCVGATLTACGSQGSFQSRAASATPTPGASLAVSSATAGASLATTSPTPSATGLVSDGGPLFVAEESHTRLGTINLLGQPAPYDMGGVMCTARVAACAPPDTVAIVGLDGYARAKTHFTPLTPPWVGGGAPLLPPQAYVASDRVFFIDGLGVVRSLALDGTVRTVASFPLGPTQQEASFAVSPDGQHLLATVITLPGKPAIVNGGVWGFGPGNWILDTYAADTGGPSRLLSHKVLAQGSQAVALLQFVGWDASGPIGTYPTALQAGGWSEAKIGRRHLFRWTARRAISVGVSGNRA